MLTSWISESIKCGFALLLGGALGVEDHELVVFSLPHWFALQGPASGLWAALLSRMPSSPSIVRR